METVERYVDGVDSIARQILTNLCTMKVVAVGGKVRHSGTRMETDILNLGLDADLAFSIFHKAIIDGALYVL